MLEPDVRHLLLDALRPPTGYALDAAFGTTFTLDLLALMAAPVAFAVFDRQLDNGSTATDPVATLQALRAHAGNLTLFCQAGEIAVPPDFRSLLVYLEESVHPVVPPKAGAIFHPKVWIIRFANGLGGNAMRLLCMSRNLTFDRSWDTILRLEGPMTDEVLHPALEAFADSLVEMARPIKPLPAGREAQVRGLGRDAARVQWEPPAPYESVRFWPLGHDGQERNPFHGRIDDPLAISPFVTSDALSLFTKKRIGPKRLISRPETLDRLGRAATAHLTETLVLMSDSALPEEADAGGADAATPDHRLEGLHAKTYIANAGWRARMWTGSANLTGAALHGNVEFLVELEGQRGKVGVEQYLDDKPSQLGLRQLVEAYPPAEEPSAETAAEALAWRLDALKRAIGSLRHTVTCEPMGDWDWRMTLRAEIAPGSLPEFHDVAVRAWPVTLGGGHSDTPSLRAGVLTAAWTVTEDRITPYVAFAVELGDHVVDFVVAADLVGAPDDRKERVLAALLQNKAALLRFLLLLLGHTDAAFAMLDSGDPGKGGFTADWDSAAALDSTVLLEPLLRAFARDRERVKDIGKVIADLRLAHGDGVLPDGWNELWDPIAEALGPGGAA